MNRLDGRRIVVTGGGSGIGRATVERCVAEGARVLIADVREALAHEAASATGAIAVRCNVADEDDVRAAIDRAADAFGGIDGLVTSAGLATPGLVKQLALEDWEYVLRVNLTGTFLAIKHALPHMERAGGGAIVTIGSVASVVVGAGGSAASYAASKGGVLQLTRAVAVEYADAGIRANCVCPGAVSTRIREHAMQVEMATTDPETRSRITIVPPQQRAAEPSEIASVVAFLLSGDASFVTGSAVMADGGYTAI